MGSYESLFQISEEQAGRVLDVSNADWLTGHAGLQLTLQSTCFNSC